MAERSKALSFRPGDSSEIEGSKPVSVSRFYVQLMESFTCLWQSDGEGPPKINGGRHGWKLTGWVEFFVSCTSDQPFCTFYLSLLCVCPLETNFLNLSWARVHEYNKSP